MIGAAYVVVTRKQSLQLQRACVENQTVMFVILLSVIVNRHYLDLGLSLSKKDIIDTLYI